MNSFESHIAHALYKDHPTKVHFYLTVQEVLQSVSIYHQQLSHYLTSIYRPFVAKIWENFIPQSLNNTVY